MTLKAILAMLAVSSLAACATLPGPSGDRTTTSAEAVALLRMGGNLIVMRHASAPPDQKTAVGMTAGCVLEGPRGLDAAGFATARLIGDWLALRDVAIAKVYTSDICRAYDTAVLVAAGRAPVIPRGELKSDDPEIAAAFKKSLEAELAVSPAANIVLVTHSNVTPLYWAGPLDGEEETPSGRVHVVRKIQPLDSSGVAYLVGRIDKAVTINADDLP